jgi:hypothetical protein
MAFDIGLKDTRTVNRACNHAERDGFMRQRPGVGPKGTTYREILTEGFTRRAAELAVIRKRYDARREASQPTPEDRAEWDEIGRQLRLHGEYSGTWSKEQVKWMRTHLFCHLRMSLRFDPTSPGHYSIVRLHAPAVDDLPRGAADEALDAPALMAPEPEIFVIRTPRQRAEMELTPDERAFSDCLVACAGIADKPNPKLIRKRVPPLLALAEIEEWELVIPWVFSASKDITKADYPPAFFLSQAPEHLETFRKKRNLATKAPERYRGMGQDSEELN